MSYIVKYSHRTIADFMNLDLQKKYIFIDINN